MHTNLKKEQNKQTNQQTSKEQRQSVYTLGENAG